MDLAAVERLRRCATCACALALATGLAWAGSFASGAHASPARYVFEKCDSALPGGGDAGVRYSQNPGVPFSAANTCERPGGSLGISQNGFVWGTYAFWTVPIGAPPGGEVESLRISGAACSQATGTKSFVFQQGFPVNCGPEQQRFFQSQVNFGAWIYLGCDGNHPEGCQAGPFVYAHYFAATEVDPVAPTLTGLHGSLLADGVIRGHQTLGVDAEDEGGGLSNVTVSVNGLPAVQPKVLNCNLAETSNSSVHGTVAAAVTPCPTKTSADWTLDTQSYPFHDGDNTVTVCAADFATLSDSNLGCAPRQKVSVDNSCTPSEVAGGEVLSAQFSGSGAEEITVPYSRGAEVTGRLANNAGDPIRGATLCVKARTLGVDPELAAVATVKTDSGGRYSYRVPPGPNRELLIGYRHDSSQVARGVRFYSHTRPTLRLRPQTVRNGRWIRLWGALPGPRAGGRVVVLQASALHSRRWLTFRRATANRHGRFHSRYRFNATTRSTTYRIRALVPRQAGYPWQEGHSNPVRVLVRG